MSRTAAPTLHIEWSPGGVRAVDVSTGTIGSGRDLSELKPFLEGRRHALVGVARHLVFLKTLRLPKAAPEDLRRILGVQIGQFFPLPADQLAFDFIQTADTTTEGCLTVVGAMRADDLRQLRTDLLAAGLTASRILPLALAAPAVAASAGRADALVVEHATSGLALDVVQGGVLRFSRVTAPGGDAQLEARRTLAAAGASDLPLVTAGGLKLPEELSDKRSTLERLDEAPPFSFELAEDRMIATAQRVALRTRLAILMMLAAILLVALVWADRSDAAAMLRRGEGAWARELGKLRSIRGAETRKAQHAAAAQEALERAFENPQPLSDMASVIGDSLPAGAWITSLTLERGKAIQIRGTAKTSADVSRFVGALGKNPRFRDVNLAFANSGKIEDTAVVQFQVTAVGVGNLPMPAPPKKIVRKAAPKAGTEQ